MWMNNLLRLCTFYNILVLTRSITFDINRQNKDIIPNDFTLSNGAWIKTTCRNSCGARYFNTDNQASNCRCYCSYNYSTFRMGATARSSSCVKNEDIRKDSGCDIYFENFGHPTNVVPVLPDYGLRVKGTHPFKCRIHGRPEYWDRGLWKTASDDLFQLSKQTLEWKSHAPKNTYSGRLVRQYLTKCQANSCIVFKVGGILKYDITLPTTTMVSKTHSTTTSSTWTPTLLTTTTTKSPTPPSTSSTTSSTVPPSTSSTTSSTALPTTTSEPTLVTTNADTTIATEQPNTKRTEKNPMKTTVISPMTEAKPSTFTTEQEGLGDKGEQKGNNSGENGDKTLTIAAISAVTVIVCVIIICVFVWFVIKKRQKCDNKAYSTDMTVITNSTGRNNSVPSNVVYCEPTEQHPPSFPKKLPHLGNPVYAKAITHGNQAKNNIPSFKMKTYKDTNHYDNHASCADDEYACPNTKQSNNKFSNNGDYCYAEPEKPIYEELPNNGAQDTIYQPLIRDSQIQDNSTGIPEYVTLVNDDGKCSNNQAIPEYLAIIPDQPMSQSPPSLEYDYAASDGQQSPALKRPGNKGLPQPPGNSPRSIQSPVYDILEQPTHYTENEYLAPIDGFISEK